MYIHINLSSHLCTLSNLGFREVQQLEGIMCFCRNPAKYMDAAESNL